MLYVALSKKKIEVFKKKKKVYLLIRKITK